MQIFQHQTRLPDRLQQATDTGLCIARVVSIGEPATIGRQLQRPECQRIGHNVSAQRILEINDQLPFTQFMH